MTIILYQLELKLMDPGALKVSNSSKTIGAKMKEAIGERKSTFFLTQSISMAIQRGNASCVLATVPHLEGLEEIFEFVTTQPDSNGRRHSSQMEEDV